MSNSVMQIAQLKEVIQKLVPLIAGKGLEVTQRGSKAYVKTHPVTGKPVSVNIPNISDNASPDFVRAIQGFIDHEVAHVLFTDFDIYTSAGADQLKLSPKQRRFTEIHNIVEDTMIEREMVKMFEGSARNLSDLGTHFIEKVTKPAIAKAGSPEEEFQYLFVPMTRALAGQKVFQNFMDDGGYWKHPVVEDVMSKLSTESKQFLAKARSTKETHKVAKEFEKIFFGDDEDDEDEEDGDDGQPSRSQDKPDKKAGAGNGTGKRDHSESKPGEEGDDEGEGTSGSGSSGGEGDESEAESEGDEGGSDGSAGSGGKPKGKMSDEVGDGNGEDVTTDGATGGGNGEFMSEEDPQSGGGGVGNGSVKKSIFEFEDDAFKEADVSSKLCIEIEEEAVDIMKAADYNVYTTEFDRIEPLLVPENINPKWIPEMEEATSLLCGRMQKDIERLMAAQSVVTRVPGYRRGRLHMASLHRVVQGDDRVFTQKVENRSKDTAVSLLIDNSGSMHGEKMRVAMLAGYALSRTLERVKITHEVIGFTTGSWGDLPQDVLKAMYDEARNSGISYDRDCTLAMPIYKDFNERVDSTVKTRIAYAMNAQRGLSGNIDGESLRVAANRLHTRSEKRKVMLVLSDGQPAGSHRAAPHLKQTVQDLKKEGIECVGIGILTDAVKKFYPNHVVLRNVNELPGEVMGQLKAILQ